MEKGQDGGPMAAEVSCPHCGCSLGAGEGADGLCPGCGHSLTVSPLGAAQGLSDRDQSSADAEQTLADAEQTLADHDQSLSDRDQHASDADQRSADADAQAGDDPVVHARTRAARERASAERSQSSHEREESAQTRLERADARDREAEERDLAAAVRDELSLHLDASDGEGAELAESHTRAARARERAAADRERARIDREHAAEDRRAAARDRDALRTSLELAATDELTAAWTRRAGLEMLDREFARIERAGGWLTIAFLDVDGLKMVNDARGHAVGDELLRTLADTVLSHVRGYDLLIRYGGDEFLCVMPGLDEAAAALRMRTIASELAAAHASIKFGVASYKPGEAQQALIDRADAAMRLARGSSD